MTSARPLFNPFPGLRPFTTAERHLFFGREAQTAELVSRLQRFRFLAAIGPSGSGKSSLVRAGLLPELHGGTLRRAGSHWRVAIMRPGGSPSYHLADALIEAGLFEPVDNDTSEIIRTALHRSRRGLVEAVRRSRLASDENLLVVVDQFEELFRFRRGTGDTADSGKAFVDLLLEASSQPELPIYIVITMRSDFLGDCARFRGLAEAINQSEYLVPRLTREQWKLAIEGPVRVGGGEIAPRLTQRLLQDVGDDPDQLPTLQHALMRTWDRWVTDNKTDRPLDLEDYEAIGGLGEALSQHADEAYDGLPDADDRRVAERVFRALTDLTADSRGVRRPTRFAELVATVAAPEAQVRRVVEAFSREGRGFLTPAGDLGADTVVDLAHESLMRIWRRLRIWADGEAQSSRMFLRLAEAAALWQSGQAGLYRDPELELALQWRARNEPNAAWAAHLGARLDPVIDFLEAGRNARTAAAEAKEMARRRELEQARQLAEAERRRAEVEARSASRMRRFALAMILLAVIAILAGLRARHLGRLARARELAVSAVQQLEVDPELSVLLAREAFRTQPIPLARQTLQSALLASHVRAALRPDGGSGTGLSDDSPPQFRKVAFSPDRSVVAAHSLTIPSTNQGRLWLWRPLGGSTNVPCGSGELKTLTFTPDSRHLLTSGGDDQARVWDVSNGALVASLPIQRQTTQGADLSPDGTLVVTAGENGHAMLWDWRANAIRADWVQPSKIRTVRFSPDGGFVATSGEDGRIRFWRRGEDRPFWTNDGPGWRLDFLGFSPDARWLATIDSIAHLRVFETKSPQRAVTNTAGSRKGRLGFSPTSDSFVLWGSEEAQIWHLPPTGESGDAVMPAATVSQIAQGSSVREALYSPDGRWVSTALANTGLRLWSTETGESTAAEFIGHRRQVDGAAFSSDGKFLASASHDGTVRLWDLEALLGKQARAPGKRDRLFAVTADGRRALVSRTDGTGAPPQIWSEVSPSTINADTADPNPADAAFSPDGRLLATTGDDAVQLHDAASGQDVVPLSWSEDLGKPLVVDFSSDGRRLAAAGGFGDIVRWRMPDRSLAGPTWHSTNGPPARLSQSRDGGVVAVVRLNDTLEIWRAQHGAPVVLPKIRNIRSIAVDPTGGLLAAGLGDGSIRLWRTDPKAPAAELRGHTLGVDSLSWSPDGRLLASGSWDGTVQLWAVDQGSDPRSAAKTSRLGVLRGFGSQPDGDGMWSISKVNFTPDGASLVVASSRGEIRRYAFPELAPGVDLESLATRQRITRGFTLEEASQYGMQ